MRRGGGRVDRSNQVFQGPLDPVKVECFSLDLVA